MESGHGDTQLKRTTSTGSRVVDHYVLHAKAIGGGCVIYKTARDGGIYAVCGDHSPITVSLSETDSDRIDGDGLHVVSPDGEQLLPASQIRELASKAEPYRADWSKHSGKGQRWQFVDRPLSPNRVLDITGQTPLLLAVDNDDGEAVQQLIAKGANVNAVNHSGMSPLFNASRDRKTRIVRILIDNHANVNLGDPLGVTPLMLACSNGDIETVRALLAAGADLSARDYRGKAARQYVSNIHHDDIVAFLNKAAAVR